MERLSDLDEMTLRCRGEEARRHLQEAVSCYRAGAYRACIVMTWIAVVYDIVDKLRELKISGDAKATALYNKHVAIQDAVRRGDPDALKQSQSFERTILIRVTEDCEFLTRQELHDLERLYEDRHRCAHPSMNDPEESYCPTAEQARLHLRNSVHHILQQAPAQGTAAIEAVMAAVASQYFPTTLEDARRQLVAGPLAKPRPKLVREVMQRLIDSMFNPEVNAPQRRRFAAAINAIHNMHPVQWELVIHGYANARMLALLDAQFMGAVAFIALVHDVWRLTKPALQEKIQAFIRANPDVPGRAYFGDLHRIPELAPVVAARISELDAPALAKLVAAGGGALTVDRCITIFSQARSWNQANYVAQELILPIIDKVVPQHVQMVLRAPRENGADLPGSAGLKEFIDAVRQRGTVSPQTLNAWLEEEGLDWYVDDGGDAV